jgi:4-methyl-5(b-hydroxyethyl)-thiazole monophosphate biosynthesis
MNRRFEMKKVFVPLAEGFEEIEAMAVIDILRRAGIDVVTAGLQGSIVKSSRNVKVIADKKIDDIKEDFDAIVLPGGNPGYLNLMKSQKIMKMIKEFDSKNKIIGAICASPMILAKLGILDNKKATIYPGMEKELPKPRSEKVIVDGNIITSQGPGTAIDFALKIVEILEGKSKADAIKKEIVY